MMERIKATRELIITKAYPKPIPLIRLRLALKAMTAASTSLSKSHHPGRFTLSAPITPFRRQTPLPCDRRVS